MREGEAKEENESHSEDETKALSCTTCSAIIPVGDRASGIVLPGPLNTENAGFMYRCVIFI